MSALEKVSLNLSSKLGNRLNKTEEEIAVLNYGLFIIMHTTISIIITVIVGIITDLTTEIVIIAFTGALYKRYSGGIHASTPSNCTIIGVLLSFIMSVICKYLANELVIKDLIILTFIMLTICNSILYIKCPVPSKNKQFKSEVARQKIRKRAFNLSILCLILILVLLIFYIKTDLIIIKTIILGIVLGMTLQMCAITSIGTKFIQELDKMLRKMKIN